MRVIEDLLLCCCCLWPFALAGFVGAVAVGIAERIENKKTLQQAKAERHAHDAEKLEETRAIRMAYYDTLAR